MTDYSKGLIYKLCCKDTDITDIYIGSTTGFRHRKSGHKGSCNNENSTKYNYGVYKFIRENGGGWENWDMVLVEYYPCETKLELEKKEREIIEKLKPTLNKKIPTRTDKEWREEHKEDAIIRTNEWKKNNLEKNKEWHKNNYKNNKEELKEKRKEKMTCDCGSTLRKTDLARHLKTIKHKNYINLLE